MKVRSGNFENKTKFVVASNIRGVGKPTEKYTKNQGPMQHKTLGKK